MAQRITTDFFERAIQEAVAYEVSKACDEAILEAQKQVAERLPEIVASVTLKVHKLFSFEHCRDEMLIHVRIEKQ